MDAAHLSRQQMLWKLKKVRGLTVKIFFLVVLKNQIELLSMKPDMNILIRVTKRAARADAVFK